MDGLIKVRDLLRAALDDFDLPTSSVSANARRALRIAALRRDYVNQLWLQWELTDMTAGKIHKWQDPAISRIKAQLDALLGAEEGRRQAIVAFLQFERNHSFQRDGQDVVLAISIGQVEQQLAASLRMYDDLAVPVNLTPMDAYVLTKQMDASKAKLLPEIHQSELVIERVKSSIHAFLVTTEVELEQGQQEAPLFLRAQQYINEALGKIAPSAIEKFVSAQDRLYSGKPEDLAHALTSCRRMIKALADALYPATGAAIIGEDGVSRTMSDDAYRNRLLQYVSEQIGRHGQGNVIRQTLDSLGPRLKSLDSLASKGVHDNVSAAEAETCIVWTYLLAADIVRIADGTSALLVDDGVEGS